MMANASVILLVVLVLLCSAAASTEELQPPDLQLLQDGTPGALSQLPRATDTYASTEDTFLGAPADECDPLNGDCPQQASGQPPSDEVADQIGKAGLEAHDTEEELWRKKTISDRNVADGIDDDDGGDEEYYEGSSVSAGGDHESGHGAVAAPPAEMAAGATVDTATPALDGSDGQNVQGEGGVNTSTGYRPPETEKKKVPLREILLRLKPASLMDDEEREAAAAATAADKGEQDGNATIAGSVDSHSLVLGGGLPSEESSSTSNTSKRAVCEATTTEEGVQLLNATGLQALVSPNANSTGRSLPAPCLMVFFFSPRCRFSTAAAPAMTALARALQGVMPVYGVDSVLYHSINAQFGVIGTPQLVLFHNGYSVAHYNASSFTPELLTSFLHHYTDHRVLKDINITEEDIKDGPLPLKASPGGGWWLAASWLLLGGVASRCFVKSALCHRLVEAVLNSWREAEAQHQHQD